MMRLFAVSLLVAAAFQGTRIEQVAWLQGCWRLTSPTRIVEENWMAPRGRSMLGASRTIRGDSLLEYETVVLRQTSSGLTYQAHPSGQASATFTALTATDASVVFENLAHDFPQRIGYRRAPGDSLHAWIEGTVRGTPRTVEFRYGRVACPG